ncbi:UPF0415 protein C7orf25 homolog [Saccoglossus kowalevskii]|uniref:UPF0415 protein C7orf25 homolog n=1 Tax=Saccoglossus kowalevskii TaxID=10224 RepID=A0ABM0MIR4_SACKO|nr:PREDICTED: UPF0415 protein C7orf25 homolog [Saccoglossus kowalevskii]
MLSLDDEISGILHQTETLIMRLKKISAEGTPKLVKKIVAEQKFLESLKNYSSDEQEVRLKSSNVHHLESVVDAAESFENVQHILRPFHYKTKGGQKASLVVDVVAGLGAAWVKVIARKAQSLHRVWIGAGDYGDRNVVDQARQYINASKQHPVHFIPPVVYFTFYGGITKPIADKLKRQGVVVKGEIVDVDSNINFDDKPEDDDDVSDEETKESLSVSPSRHISMTTKQECSHLNLDITTLIALVSELTHGGCWYEFKETVLTDQAVQEQQDPLIPKLNEYLKDKDLFSCKTAVKAFKTILSTLGGRNERQRARKLLEQLTVVDDEPSKRTEELKKSGRIKPRSKIIFGTGDSIRATTVTANSSFVRAAADQGVNFDVFIHQPRALTESKQASAVPVTPPAVVTKE